MRKCTNYYSFSRLAAVSLMDLGFSSHAFHSSARLVFLEHTISHDRNSLTFTLPAPGPATVFLTSEGVQVIVGSGDSPPTLECH